MGYFSHSVLANKQKFLIKIEKTCQLWNFEIDLKSGYKVVNFTTPNLIIFFNYDKKFVFVSQNCVGKIPHK